MSESKTLILNTATLFIVPLQLMFSLFLLLRGHDEPGGGFIAGLVAAGAIALYAFAFGVEAARQWLRFDPRDLLAAGLLLGLGSTLPALIAGEPLLTAAWWSVPLPGGDSVKLSSPLIFDVGVYCAVIGTIVTIVMGLMEAEE